MKRSKLLFLTPCIALTAIPVTSCGDNNNVLTIENVEKALFEPHMEVMDRPEGCDTYIECLSHISDKDRKTELIYSMFAPLFYVPGLDPFDNETIWDLWKDNTFTLSANISKCSLNVKDGKAYANFVGYVNLVFQKSYEGFVKNNFLQFTLLLDNEEVTPQGSNWYLHFKNEALVETHKCWGFAQIKHNDSTYLFYLDYLGWEYTQTFTSFPSHWHNWKSN